VQTTTATELTRRLRIEPVLPGDDEALAAWHATYDAASRFGREFSTPYALPEIRADLTTANPGERMLLWSGYVDEPWEPLQHQQGVGAATAVTGVAVTGIMFLPLMDNLQQAWVEVDTLPALRRRGLGSQMLDHLVQVARDQGRSILASEAAYPYAGPADGAGQESVEFLLRRGFTLGLADVQRRLELPADEALLERLVQESAPHHTDYAIRSFTGPVPEDLRAAYARTVGELLAEAPMGELHLEREVIDEERMRAGDERFAAAGRTRWNTVAVAGDGTVAAYSELVVPEHDPGMVYQWGTLVLPEHRGHRLGLATKAANLLRLQHHRPDLREVRTYNAESNTHMVAVNDAMGFRPVERLGEFERRLA
jgi:GNAT superfamily N-acetyltransferase